MSIFLSQSRLKNTIKFTQTNVHSFLSSFYHFTDCQITKRIKSTNSLMHCNWNQNCFKLVEEEKWKEFCLDYQKSGSIVQCNSDQKLLGASWNAFIPVDLEEKLKSWDSNYHDPKYNASDFNNESVSQTTAQFDKFGTYTSTFFFV